MSIAFDLSQSLAALVEQAAPYTVRVEGRRRLPATGIVYRRDGLIVTANHVVERDDNLKVALADGSSHNATLVGRDPGTDLALLRVEAADLVPAVWAAPAELRVGHLVLALGRPGRTVQATLGILSALGGSWRSPGGAEIEHYVQTDVAMYPGFSGGPLLAADGRLAGLNTSALVQGISVALPSTTIARVVETLAAHGKVPRGYLGVGIQPVRLTDAIRQRISQETGLMVMSVESGSPAEAGGLLQGDILVRLNDTPIRHVDELQAQLASATIGQPSLVRVVRGGDLRDLTVTIGQAR